MTTRGERITQVQKTPDLFSDFLSDLSSHPISKDVVRVTNERAIKTSIRNLIQTNFGERLYQPSIGSSINRALFEPNDFVLEDDISSSIRKTLANHEPRVSVVDVVVLRQPDDYNIRINIVFSIINSTEIQSLDVILRRVR